MQKALLTGTALAIIITAACGGNSPQPAPTRPVATATATQSQNQVEYLVTRTFTASEFEAWVDSAEKDIATATGIAAWQRSLEEVIVAETGKKAEYRLVQSIGAQGLMVPGEAYKKAVVDIGGRYDTVSDMIFLKQNDPLERIGSFSEQPGNATVTKLNYLLHELYHRLSDAHSEVDAVERLFASRGMDLLEVEVNGLPAGLVTMQGAAVERQEAYGFGEGGLIFHSEIPESDARGLLTAYNGLVSNEEAGKELGEKIMGIMAASLANRVISEAQAYFAQPLNQEVRTDKSELEISVIAAVPEQRGLHVDYARKAVDDIVRGYAALEKSGVSMEQANIRMAVFVGQSTAVSRDEFLPYRRLNVNVSSLVVELGLGEPTTSDVSRVLRNRSDYHLRMSADMGNALADYIVRSVVWPFVAERLPREFGGLAEVIPESSFRIKETKNGYELTAAAMARRVQ